VSRFFRRGISKIYFLPAVASLAAPTTAEIAAGVDLSPQIAEVGGFQLSNAPIPTPNLAEQFTPQIDGEDTVADSSLTMYDLDSSTTLRTATTKGTAGFFVLMPYGRTAAKRCEVWPAKITGQNDEWSTATGNNPARYVTSAVITATPTQNGVNPA
jgi:hypothetical protein